MNFFQRDKYRARNGIPTANIAKRLDRAHVTYEDGKTFSVNNEGKVIQYYYADNYTEKHPYDLMKKI